MRASVDALSGRLAALQDHTGRSLAAASQAHAALEREVVALRATCDAGTSELDHRQQVRAPLRGVARPMYR